MQTNRPITESSQYQILCQISSTSLKRPRAASEPCESDHARRRKKSKGVLQRFKPLANDLIEEDEVSEFVNVSKTKGKGREGPPTAGATSAPLAPNGMSPNVVEDLALELTCGCCTELCYNPVIVNPCQHFFCGSCCMMWIKNGGTNCPACRSPSTVVIPSRVLQSMIDLLLRFDPSKARTEADKAEADDVYKSGTSFRLPTPRPGTPEPNVEPPNDNFARPCPTCPAGNLFGWRCPIPIHDPIADPEHAFDLDEGTPIGHAFCGNCDQLHNLQGPSTTKCDFCQASFCGIGVQERCCAMPLQAQQPHGFNELQDLILCSAIYEKFHGNHVEVDILFDYLQSNEISLWRIYKQIITFTLHQPQGFTPFIDGGIFDDLHEGSGGDDPDPTAPRRVICRLCAAQILMYGLKDWWIREREHAALPEEIQARQDCPQGNDCPNQADPRHCKEFNHIIRQPSQTHNLAGQPAHPNSAVVLPLEAPLSAQPSLQLPPLSRERFGRFTLSDILPPIPMQFPTLRRNHEIDDEPYAESPPSSPSQEVSVTEGDVYMQPVQDQADHNEFQGLNNEHEYLTALEASQNSQVYADMPSSNMSNSLPSYSLPDATLSGATSTNEGFQTNLPNNTGADPNFEGNLARMSRSHPLLPML